MSPAEASSRDINQAEYARYRDLVQERSGLKFNDSQRENFERIVAKCAQEAGYTVPDNYYDALLKSNTDSGLWGKLLEGLTVCETYFFRDRPQINVLKNHILPDLIARHWVDHSLRLWSAGCSTGEEPYTLAILLHQLLPDIQQWKISILATDINRQSLKKAKQATYREWSFRENEIPYHHHYFTESDNGLLLNKEIQKLVTFAYLNLSEDTYPSAANNTENMDLILCRNVTIYMPEKVIQSLADGFYRCLTPGGWLMVGPSETNDAIYHQFQTLNFKDAIAYQKIGSERLKTGIANSYSFRIQPSVSQSATKQTPAKDIFQPPNKPSQRSKSAPTPEATAPRSNQQLLTTSSQVSESSEILLNKARNAANSGNAAEARTLATRLIEADPLMSEAHYLMGIAFLEEGEPERALSCFKKVVYLDPDHILAHFQLYNIFLKSGREAESSRHRANVISLASSYPPEQVLPGSDDLTAANVLSMIKI